MYYYIPVYKLCQVYPSTSLIYVVKLAVKGTTLFCPAKASLPKGHFFILDIYI